MANKGYPSQKKLNTPIVGVTEKFTRDQFVTAQPNYSDKVSQDVVSGGLFRLTAIQTVTAASTISPKRSFTATAHGGSIGDVVRFEPTAANPGFEGVILDTPDANTIVLGAETPNNIAIGNSFFILRSVTARLDDTGATISVSTSGPIQFVLDGTDTEVSQDTGVPANSVPLPIQYLDSVGKRTDLATEATLQTVSTSALQTANNVLVGAVNETAPASDTANSGLNGRLQRIAQRLTSLIALFPATIGQKADAASLAVSISTEGTAQIGSLTEAAPASDTASSGLNGRLQRIAQRLTSLIAQVPATLGQKTMANSLAVTVASDQSAFPVTVSGSAYSDSTSSGTITTQNLVPLGSATAGSAVEISAANLNSRGSVIVSVTGTYTGALSIQISSDGSVWRTLAGAQTVYNISTGAYSATIASAAQGDFQIFCAGYYQVRVSALAAVTGTATVAMRTSSVGGSVIVQGPLPTGTNVIGALTSNQSVNIAQMNGVATSMSAGADGTGTQRVTISNNASATLANVSASASSVAVLASAATRRNATFFNDSTAILYLKFGATASTTSYTVQIAPNGYYELPQPCYSGAIDGIWSSATGTVRVTSW